MEITFPGATQSMLNSITKVCISIIQLHIFIITVDGEKQRITDRRPVTRSVKIVPSKSPSWISIPLSPLIMGRFTTGRFRISHKLRVAFHRRWGHWKSTWEEEVEIFQPISEVENETTVPEFGLMEHISSVEPGGRSIRCDEVVVDTKMTPTWSPTEKLETQLPE